MKNVLNAIIRWLFSPLLVFLGLLLVSCGDTWNNPLPNGDEKITYYSSYSSQPKVLDPVRSYSTDEALFIDQVYEAPLQYHYLKRPYILEPATAQSMPTVAYLNENFERIAEGSQQEVSYSEFKVTIKKGILYQPHPGFVKDQNGRLKYLFENEESSSNFKSIDDFPETSSRELVAADYVYQFKRMAVPENKAPLRGFMSEYIVGMKEFTEAVEKKSMEGEWLDLRAIPMTGVKALDDQTFIVRLYGQYPQFMYWLAFRFFAPIPWEVDQFYHNPGFEKKHIGYNFNTVGTGPFMLTTNQANRLMVLERNPNYRQDYYPSEGEPGDEENGFLADAGRALPLIDRAMYFFEKESIPRWTKFNQGYYDRSHETKAGDFMNSSFDQAFQLGVDGFELTPELIEKNIRVDQQNRPSIFYIGFNMLDPVVGGYTEDKQKLRQALAIAWDSKEFMDIFQNGLGLDAQGPIPPGLFGYREGQAGMTPYNYVWENGKPKKHSIEYAKQLLVEAGYPGGRDKNTGKPLVISMDVSRQTDQYTAWVVRQFKKIGVQLEMRMTDYARMKERIRQGGHQLFAWGWVADYPDPENFLFLFESNQGSVKCQCDGANNSNYDRPEYDVLFEKMKSLENGPERQEVVDNMVQMLWKDQPWIWHYHDTSFYLAHEWVRNTKRHGISLSTLKFVGIDEEKRSQSRKQWNQPQIWPLIVFIAFILVAITLVWLAYRRRKKATIELEV